MAGSRASATSSSAESSATLTGCIDGVSSGAVAPIRPPGEGPFGTWDVAVLGALPRTSRAADAPGADHVDHSGLFGPVKRDRAQGGDLRSSLRRLDALRLRLVGDLHDTLAREHSSVVATRHLVEEPETHETLDGVVGRRVGDGVHASRLGGSTFLDRLRAGRLRRASADLTVKRSDRRLEGETTVSVVRAHRGVGPAQGPRLGGRPGADAPNAGRQARRESDGGSPTPGGLSGDGFRSVTVPTIYIPTRQAGPSPQPAPRTAPLKS